MSVPLAQLLALVGPLDDAPGFESPRERFRGFLEEHVDGFHALKSLIEEAGRSAGPQHQRALQDCIVMLGRFLGFETTFGAYQRLSGGVQFQGHWRSLRRLNVVLAIVSDRAARGDVEDLSRSLAAFTAARSDGESTCIGLFVAAGHQAHGSPEASNVLALSDRCRIASTRSLLLLAEMTEAGRLTHEDVVKLLESASNVDSLVDLIGRFDASGVRRENAFSHDSPTIDETMESEPDYWMALAGQAGAAAFEQIVKAAVGGRRVLGAAEDRAHAGVACAGDWVAFLVPGKGIVGHAKISFVADRRDSLMRDSDASDHVYRLQDVELYDLPIVVDAETEHGLLARYERSGVSGPLLLSVSRQKFETLAAVAEEDGTPALRRHEPLRLAHPKARTRWLA